MSSRAATSRFAMAAPYAAARSASPAGMPASVAAGVGSLAAVRDATERLIIASQRIRFIVCSCGAGPLHQLPSTPHDKSLVLTKFSCPDEALLATELVEDRLGDVSVPGLCRSFPWRIALRASEPTD